MERPQIKIRGCFCCNEETGTGGFIPCVDQTVTATVTDAIGSYAVCLGLTCDLDFDSGGEAQCSMGTGSDPDCNITVNASCTFNADLGVNVFSGNLNSFAQCSWSTQQLPIVVYCIVIAGIDEFEVTLA